MTLSQTEDGVDRSAPLWLRLLEKAQRFHEAALHLPCPHPLDRTVKLLDLGCGLGYAATLWSERYRHRGAVVVAADLSPKYLLDTRRVAEFCQATLLYSAVDAHNLPFQDSTFDAVWTAHLLYRTDPCRVSHEVHRVLRPGGSWVALESAMPNTQRVKDEYRERYENHCRRGRPFTLMEWERFAREHAMSVTLPGTHIKAPWLRRTLSHYRAVHVVLRKDKPA